MGSSLYNSFICRLCADDCQGSFLSIFVSNGSETFSDAINRYLPIKVEDDRLYPTKICLTCKNVVLCIGEYLEKLIIGQKQINTVLKQLTVFDKCHNLGGMANYPSGDKLYASNHPIRSAITKKKRGRPKKARKCVDTFEGESLMGIASANDNTVSQPNISIRDDVLPVKRVRKTPNRYAQGVGGKELDKILSLKPCALLAGIDLLTEGTSVYNIDEDGSVPLTDLVLPPNARVDSGIMGCQDRLGTQEVLPTDIVLVNGGNALAQLSNSTSDQNDAPDTKHFTCKICGKKFKQRGRLLIHRRNHGIVKYQCLTCQTTFNVLESLKSHQNNLKHWGQGIIETGLPIRSTKFSVKCSLCPKSFQTKQGLDSHHKAKHKNIKPFSCELCNKEFAYSTSLKIHLLTHQNQIALHKCKSCPKTFKTKLGCHKHEQQFHTNEELRPYPCSDCGKVFRSRKSLKDHKEIHTHNIGNENSGLTCASRNVCDICQKSFPNRSALNIHQRMHTGEKPFQCETCGKGFTQKGNMLNHKKLHTNNKPYKCSSCSKSFSSRNHLVLHAKRHIGDRSHKCPYCHKAFYHKEGLNIHIRRHLDVKPYICQICNKGFCDSWALTKHSRVHTGLKPYTCDVCGKTFSDCSNLNKHKKFHSAPSSPSSELLQTFSNNSQVTANDSSIFFITQTNSIEEDFQDKRNAQQIIYVTYEEPQEREEANLVNSMSFQEDRSNVEPRVVRTLVSNIQTELLLCFRTKLTLLKLH